MSWFDDAAGGLDRYFESLLGALRGEGSAAVGIAAGTRAPTDGDRVVPTRPLGRRLRAFAAAARELVCGADLVDSHFALHAAAVLAVRRVRHRPLVVHFQGPWHAESGMVGAGRVSRAAKRRLERSVYRRADRIVVLSAAFGTILEEDFGVPGDRIVVLHPGVDVERFSPGPTEGARASLGIGPEPVVVCVRRLVDRVGIDVLVRAFVGVRRALPDSLLLIAGDGPRRADLERLAAELHPAGAVRFLGRVSDDALVDLYRVADVTAVPTVALEGFGLVTLESLACGTPVVVTDVDGLPEVPRALDPGCVVPARDPDALGARLTAALDGSRPLPDAARCRDHAMGYTWATVARRHLSLYNEVARSS